MLVGRRCLDLISITTANMTRLGSGSIPRVTTRVTSGRRGSTCAAVSAVSRACSACAFTGTDTRAVTCADTSAVDASSFTARFSISPKILSSFVGAFISHFLVSGREGRGLDLPELSRGPTARRIIRSPSGTTAPRCATAARSAEEACRNVPAEIDGLCTLLVAPRSALRGGVPNSVCMFADERPPSRPSRRQSSNSSTRSKQARAASLEQDQRKLTR